MVVAGIAVGWSLHAGDARSFDYVHALLSPVGMAVMCSELARAESKHARWLVPLFLIAILLNVLRKPHVPAVSAIGFTAGAVALVASLRELKRTTIASSLVCGVAIGVSLFAALVVHR